MPDVPISQTINWTAARMRALQVDLADEATADRRLALRQCLEDACAPLDAAHRRELLAALRGRFPVLCAPLPAVAEAPPTVPELATRLVARLDETSAAERASVLAVLGDAGLVIGHPEPAAAPAAVEVSMEELVGLLAGRLGEMGAAARQQVLRSLGGPEPARAPAAAEPKEGSEQVLNHLAEAVGQLNTILERMWENLRPEHSDGLYPSRGLERELTNWLVGEGEVRPARLRSQVNELVRFAAAMFAAFPRSLDTYTQQLANRIRPANIERVVGSGMLARGKCWDRYRELAEKEFSPDHARGNLFAILLREIRSMRDASGS